MLEATGAAPGDLVLIVADRADRVAVALDGLRRTMAARLELIREGEWQFLWVTEPPLFEWSDEEQRWVGAAPPVHRAADGRPRSRDREGAGVRPRPERLRAGSGSIRIHRPDLQRKVFEALGSREAEIEEKFGHLIRAFRYGVPPHGGHRARHGPDGDADGREGAIRDVIAFPKAQSGADPLTGAPAPVDEVQLRELGLRVILPSRGARVRGEGAGMTSLNDDDVELLTGNNFAHVGAISPDGTPHVTVTWIDAADGYVLVNTAVGRVKDRYVRRDPRVSVSLHDEEDPYRWLRGRRRRGGVRDRPRGRCPHRRAQPPLPRRRGVDVHPGQQRVIYRIRPERILRRYDG